MIFRCFRCDKEKSFKNDDDAQNNGWAIVGYNMAQNERYANCTTCLELINQNRQKLLDKQKTVVTKIIPAREPEKIKKKSKNEMMFEAIPGI